MSNVWVLSRSLVRQGIEASLGHRSGARVRASRGIDRQGVTMVVTSKKVVVVMSSATLTQCRGPKEVAMLVDRACGDLRDLFPVLDFVGWIFVLRGRFWVLDCMRRNQPYTVRRTPHAARRAPRGLERERGQGMRAHAVSAERSTASPGPRYHTHLSNCVGCESARRSGAVTNEACLRPAPQIPAIGHVIIGPDTVGSPAQSSSHVFF